MLYAVIDRFEEDKAVLLVGESETKVVFPRRLLPRGLREGDYLQLNIAYDEVATQRARAEAKSLLTALQQENT